MVDLDIGIKRPEKFTPAIREKPLAVMGELDIGTITETIPTITQAIIVDC